MPSPGSVFLTTPDWPEKNFFYHFEIGKIASVLIYNIFVTKEFFFKNERQKNCLTCMFLVDLVRWRQTIFKSGLINFLNIHFSIFHLYLFHIIEFLYSFSSSLQQTLLQSYLIFFSDFFFHYSLNEVLSFFVFLCILP